MLEQLVAEVLVDVVFLEEAKPLHLDGITSLKLCLVGSYQLGGD